jgi:lipopolysaccharide assembly outer membrane protein LptD (OstA)
MDLKGQTILDSLTSDLNIEGLETTYDPETGLAMAKGDVYIHYADVEIRCGSASYNAKTGEVIARENVIVWKAGITYRGENITYNANTGDIQGESVRSSTPNELGSFFFETDTIDSASKVVKRIDGGESYLTTHDSEDPNFRLKASSMTIYPEDRIEMKGVKLIVGDTPIFYLPSLTQAINEDVGYRFTPGYQSRWGAFLLNQWGAIHGDHTLARYRLDLRSARGVGVGADWMSLKQRKNWSNLTGLKLYYKYDTDPEATSTSEPRGPMPTNRYRVNFQHRIYVPGPEKSTWYLDFDINKLSDAHFYEDFFFNEFRTQPEPDNQVSLVHTDPRYVATLMTRFQANDFYTVGSKLPELAVDWTRRPLWNTGLFHQGTVSAGIYREQFSVDQKQSLLDLRSAINAGQSATTDSMIAEFLGISTSGVGANEYGLSNALASNNLNGLGFARVHTYQELLLPKTFFGWLNVVPRIGAGFTHYEGIDGGIKSIDTTTGTSTSFDSFTRGLIHAGLDISFKVSKSWEDYKRDGLGIDGLRHVMQPYISLSYLNANQPDGGMPIIDRLSRTTRPRSLDLPLYSAVDSLSSWNVARLGVRNHLQTRRDYTSENNSTFLAANDSETQTYTFAGLNTYVDLFAKDPERDLSMYSGQPFDRSISNLYNELFFRPVPWINFWLDMQLPLGSSRGNFTEVNQGITFLPSSKVALTLGHQYVADSPYIQDSSLMFSRIYARFNDNWGFAMNHVYELDGGTLEFQSYSFTRDLTSWIASVGAMVRDNRGGQIDSGIMLSFTLKDFPQFTLPLDIDPNPSGRGGNQSAQVNQ